MEALLHADSALAVHFARCLKPQEVAQALPTFHGAWVSFQDFLQALRFALTRPPLFATRSSLSLEDWRHIWDQCEKVTKARGFDVDAWGHNSVIEMYDEEADYLDTVGCSLSFPEIEWLIREALRSTRSFSPGADEDSSGAPPLGEEERAEYSRSGVLSILMFKAEHRQMRIAGGVRCSTFDIVVVLAVSGDSQYILIQIRALHGLLQMVHQHMPDIQGIVSLHSGSQLGYLVGKLPWEFNMWSACDVVNLWMQKPSDEEALEVHFHPAPERLSDNWPFPQHPLEPELRNTEFRMASTFDSLAFDDVGSPGDVLVTLPLRQARDGVLYNCHDYVRWYGDSWWLQMWREGRFKRR